jgi:hypothetical protein
VERCAFSRATLDLLIEAEVINALIEAVRQVTVALGHAGHAIDTQPTTFSAKPAADRSESCPSRSIRPL